MNDLEIKELAKAIIGRLAEAHLLCDELDADPMEAPPQDLLDQAVEEVEKEISEWVGP